jgi:hypothetical protein
LPKMLPTCRISLRHEHSDETADNTKLPRAKSSSRQI